jgi:pyruvate dehydrogenase E2 component (dihydrolipoyllysine-residue acetyltransferase)
MTSIQMPQLGETIVEGTILKWLKQEGEHIDRDEPLFEISTDKVDTEVPSPVAGTLTKILVPEGQTVPVGTELARIGDGEAVGDASSAERAPADEPAEETPAEPVAAPSGDGPAPADEPAEEAPAAPVAAPSGDGPAPAASAGRSASAGAAAAVAPLPDRGPRSKILSPLVRRLAQEHEIDLSQIQGTGTGGRITKKDVMTVVATGGAPASEPSVEPVPASRPAPAFAPGAGDEVRPVSHIRKAIAAHMLASVQTSARAWTMVEVNVEQLVRLRERAKDSFFAAHGVKLTYLPFVIRATVDALQAHQEVNARLNGENIVLHRYVNMGIAVSYDEGLIVPVIRGAEAMNTVGLARSLADLAARARSHQLNPDEVQGATFTITNPGPYGSLASVPIINQPNTGILSLDAIVKRPVVVEDDAIAVRHMVYISMSWDHRTIDGEVATRFLARVKENLETWDFAEDLGL